MRWACAVALVFAWVVVVAGAFVRLSDAGLGCPDWPQCYGELIGIGDEQAAAAQYPASVYDPYKAWVEVAHRYLAAALGLLIVILAAVQWRRQRRLGVLHLLVVAVIAQGIFGMLTVTQLLQPAIVVAHLFGGMLILSLLTYATTKQFATSETMPMPPTTPAVLFRLLGFICLLALFVQIVLGGWVSASYAGLACPDFPTCHGNWTPPALDFSGYHPSRELHADAAGAPITAAAQATMHWLHRLGAAVLFVLLLTFIVCARRRGMPMRSALLSALLLAQVIIGILIVVYQLPLPLALAHNAVAALLVITLTAALPRRN